MKLNDFIIGINGRCAASISCVAEAIASGVRLIGVDVDGTLVGASGQVPPHVWEAADRAREAGLHLALCSGRPAFGVALDYARRLDPRGWHVFQNGASIVHLDSERSLSVTIPPAPIRTLIEAARRTGRVLELYSDSDYVTESTSDWAREHAKLLGIPFEPRPFDALRTGIVRAQWLVSAEDAPAVMRSAPPQLEVAQSTSPIMPGTCFVGLTREGVSKGSAMRAIAAEYGVGLDQVMYVGDAGNDLSALRIVGVPVAMSNADPAVLAVAKHVAGNVEHGGIVAAFALAIRSHQY
jgi:Cof subfamily protein (haloacid dehalogenase superfamily)